MTKFWHLLGSFAAIAATVYSPQIQHAISAHPQVGVGIAAAYAIIGNLIQSPVAPEPPQPPVVPKS